MAKVDKASIDKDKVVAGRLIRVWNADRKKFSNESRQYTALWVEDKNGKNERCWLLTDKEIARLEHRSQRNKEDLTKKNFMTDLMD